MPWNDVLGMIAGGVSLGGFLPYVRDVLARRTVPSRSTWLIWTVVGSMLCASAWRGGASETLWISGSYVAGPLVVFLLSLRFGAGGWSRLDRLCLLLSALSAVLWTITREPLLALWLNIGVDSLGAVPTIAKTGRAPDSESRPAWACFFAGALLTLVAARSWSLAAIAYPLYLFAVSTVMLVFILGRKRRVSDGSGRSQVRESPAS
jgi:hypothetical protein